MATDLTVQELKNILRKKNVPTTGNKSELMLRLEQNNPDGSWAEEWRRETNELKDKDDDLGQSNYSDEDTQELRQQLASMQQMLVTLTLQLQQNGVLNKPNPQHEGVPRDTSTSPVINSSVQNVMVSPQGNTAQGSSSMLPPTLQGMGASVPRQVPSQQVTSLQNIEVNTKVSINAVGELLGIFDGNGENFDSWSQQVELIRSSYNLNDSVTRILISSKLKGKALDWFHSRPDHLSMPIMNLMTELRKMFFPFTSKIKLRKQFESRTWNQNESFSEYAFEKILLSNRVNIDESELVDFIIEGIPDGSLKNHARMQRFNSKESLINAFETISLNKNSNVSSKNKDIHRTDNDNRIVKSETRDVLKPIDRDRKRCYNCGRAGHMALDCKKEKRPRGSCYRCASMNHTISNCPENKKKSNNSEVTNVDKRTTENSEYYPDIILKFEIEECVYDVHVIALLDSGSPISFIKSKFVNPSIILPIENKDLEYHGVNNSKLRIMGKTKVKCQLRGLLKEIELLIVNDDTMTPAVILGRDAFRTFGLGLVKQDHFENKVEDNHLNEIMNIEVEDLNVSEMLEINAQIPVESKQQLIDLFTEIYVNSKRPEQPKIKTTLRLRLKEHKPFHCTPRRLSFTEKIELKRMIDDLIKRKILRVSNAEYSSPIVLVRKKMAKLECV